MYTANPSLTSTVKAIGNVPLLNRYLTPSEQDECFDNSCVGRHSNSINVHPEFSRETQ